MNKSVTPVVMGDDGERHVPMREGEVVGVSFLPISPSKQNLIGADDTGLLLTGQMLVSEQENNPVVANVDGKLYLRVRQMLSPEDKVLKVSDNLIRADLALRFDPATSRLALLGKGGVVISEFTLPVAAGLPSVVEILQDYTPPAPDGFVENPFGKGTYLHMRFSVVDGGQKDIYIDVSKLVDVYIGGLGITVENNKISVVIKEGSVLYFADCCDSPDCACGGKLDVSIPAVAERLVSPDDTVLSVRDGRITSELRLGYDSDKRIITLFGVNDVVIGAVALPDAELPEIPNLPIDAEFVNTPQGMAPGKYLHLVFKLADGTLKDLYLDVTELVDVYEGGSGVSVSGNVISVKLSEAPSNPLAFNSVGALTVSQKHLVSKMPDNILRVSEVDSKLYVPNPGVSKESLGLGLVMGADDKIDVDMRSLVASGSGLEVGRDGMVSINLDELAELLADKLKAGVSDDSGNILTVGSDGKPYYPGSLGSL